MAVDAPLVRAAQRGDTLAMNRLLDELGPYVGRICAPIALADAADATQETLIQIFRSLHTVREPDTIYGWARTVAVREAVRLAKRRQRDEPTVLDDIPVAGDPQLAVDVTDTLRNLSPEHRAVLVLRELEGLDERRAADVLGVPEGTVKSRLHRARASFRKAWKQ